MKTETKFVALFDRMTCIPCLAMRYTAENNAELTMFKRHGFGGSPDDRYTFFYLPNFGTCSYDPYKLGDSEFTFSNTYWAGISRYMVLYDKSLLYHPIEFKDSDIDCYGILPVSYLPNLGKDNE